MSAIALVLRIGAVFALLLAVLWLVRRTGSGALRRGGPMQVVGSTRLGKTSSVALVRIGGQTFALGITDQSVSILAEIPEGTVLTEPEPVVAAAPVTPEVAPARRTSPPTMAEFVTDLARRGRTAYLARRGGSAPAAQPDSIDLTTPALPALVVPVPADTERSFDEVLVDVLGLGTPAVDGSTAVAVTRAPRTRLHARTDGPARRDEDAPWTTRCRQARPPRSRGSHVY